MGKRLTESFKLQVKAMRRKQKKAKVEKQRPTFKNLDISYDRANETDIKVVVSDVMNVQEKERITSAVSVDPTGSTFIIKGILCPFCNRKLDLNHSWGAYICPKNDAHEKKVFEICRVI
jgi:hypothetical protein